MFIDSADIVPQGHPDDAYIWQQIKNGEKAGMEGLYLKYSQQLFKFGISIKGDRNFIKDCIHEVFVNIWKYRESIPATDNVKLYLFKCLSNRIYKEIAIDKRRYSQVSIDHLEISEAGDAIDSDTAFSEIGDKKRIRLLNALENLPTRQKEVIQLLFFENETYEDTSIIMGINVQSVYNLAWKAISNLKKKILVLWPALIGFVLNSL